MKTLEEVGNNIARLILSGHWTTHEVNVILAEFAEERCAECGLQSPEKARAEALEEAAKLMDNCHCAHEGVAAEIRALKGKP